MSSLSCTGAGLGYREVATPSLPAPPVQPFCVAGGDLVVAPIYMSADGAALGVFD